MVACDSLSILLLEVEVSLGLLMAATAGLYAWLTSDMLAAMWGIKLTKHPRLKRWVLRYRRLVLSLRNRMPRLRHRPPESPPSFPRFR